MVGRVLWIQLSRLVCVHDAPLFMRSDNGPEFDNDAILEWIAHAGIATVLNFMRMSENLPSLKPGSEPFERAA